MVVSGGDGLWQRWLRLVKGLLSRLVSAWCRQVKCSSYRTVGKYFDPGLAANLQSIWMVVVVEEERRCTGGVEQSRVHRIHRIHSSSGVDPPIL